MCLNVFIECTKHVCMSGIARYCLFPAFADKQRPENIIIQMYLGFCLFVWFVVLCPSQQSQRSGSVVECLTRDREARGLSLTGVTALCP